MPEDFDWTPFEGDKWTANDVGDSITGTITKLEVGQGQRGDYPIVVLATDDGEKSVGASTDLARKLAQEKPQVGDRVRMTLTDLKHTGQPQPMKVFKLEVRRGNGVAPEPDPDPMEAPFVDHDDELI